MAYWFQLATLAMLLGFALSAYFASTLSGLGRTAQSLRGRSRRGERAVLPSDAVPAAGPK